MADIVVIGSGIMYGEGGILDSISPDIIPPGLNITFVDSGYDIIFFHQQDFTNDILRQERKRVTAWNPVVLLEGQPIPMFWESSPTRVRIVAMPYWRWIRQPAYKPPSSDQNIIYIVCENYQAQDTYEIMDRIESSLIANRQYIGVDRRNSDRLNIFQYTLSATLESRPDFYIGQGPIPERYRKIAEEFFRHMHMIETGKGTPMTVPGWVFNTETPFIRGVIERHGLKAIGYGANLTPPDDHTPQFLMLNSEIYRKTLTRIVGRMLRSN